ncbi:MAG TPA: hypothetical protein VHP54_07830 [Caproiciproducens sp.]|nr:hypothetical protein [Caproiciproducens sp.]
MEMNPALIDKDGKQAERDFVYHLRKSRTLFLFYLCQKLRLEDRLRISAEMTVKIRRSA